MLLNVPDRLTLLTILPKEGDLLSLRIIRELQNTLAFSEEDHVKYKIREEGTSISYDDKVEGKEVEIGRKAYSLICAAFEDLNARKKLELGWLPTAERFLTGAEGATPDP